MYSVVKNSLTLSTSVYCFIVSVCLTQLFLKVQCQIVYLDQNVPVIRDDHVLVPIANPLVRHFTPVKKHSNNDKTLVTFGPSIKDRQPVFELPQQVTTYSPRDVIPTTESISDRVKPTVSVSDRVDIVSKATRPTIGVIGLKYNFDDIWKPEKALLAMSDDYIKQDMKKGRSQNEDEIDSNSQNWGWTTTEKNEDYSRSQNKINKDEIVLQNKKNRDETDSDSQNWGWTTTEKYEDYSIRPLNIWQAEAPEINKQLFGDPSKEKYQTTPAPLIWQAKSPEVNKQLFGDPLKGNDRQKPSVQYYPAGRTNTKLQENQPGSAFLIEPSIEIWRGIQQSHPEPSQQPQRIQEQTNNYSGPKKQVVTHPESVTVAGSQQNDDQRGHLSPPTLVTPSPHPQVGYERLNNQENIGPSQYKQHYPSMPNYQAYPEPTYTPTYQPVFHHTISPVTSTQNSDWREDFGHSNKPKYESVNGRWLLNGGPILQNNFFDGKNEAFHGWGGFHAGRGVSQTESSLIPNSYVEHSGRQQGIHENTGFGGSGNKQNPGRENLSNYNGYSDPNKNENPGPGNKQSSGRENLSNYNGYSDSNKNEYPRQPENQLKYSEYSGSNNEENLGEENLSKHNAYGNLKGEKSSGQHENQEKHYGYGGSSNEENSGNTENQENPKVSGEENSRQENQGNYNGYGGSSNEENSEQPENQEEINGYGVSSNEDSSGQMENLENINGYSDFSNDDTSSQEERNKNYSENRGSNENNSREGSNESSNEERSGEEHPLRTDSYGTQPEQAYSGEDTASQEYPTETANGDPRPDKVFGTDAAFKPLPPDPDEESVRNRVSDHEFPRKVPTRLQYRGGGLWAKPHPDSGIDLGWVPKQVYSQVRKYNTVKHLPRSAALAAASTQEEIINAPRLREVVSDKKIQEVYEEEGYEDSAYDHGGYNKHGEHSEGKEKGYSENDNDRSDLKVPTEEEAHQQHAEKIKEVDQIGYDTKNSAQKQADNRKYNPDVRGIWKSRKVTTNEKSMTFAGDDGRGGVLTEKLRPQLEASVGKYVMVDGKHVPFVQHVPETFISHGDGASYQRFYQPKSFSYKVPVGLQVEHSKPTQNQRFNDDSVLEGSDFISDTETNTANTNPMLKELKHKKHFNLKVKKIPIKFSNIHTLTTTENPTQQIKDDPSVYNINPTVEENPTDKTHKESDEEMESSSRVFSTNYKIQHTKRPEQNVETYSSGSIYMTSTNFTESEKEVEDGIPANHKPDEEDSKIPSLVTPKLFSHKQLIGNSKTKIPISIRKDSKNKKEFFNNHETFPKENKSSTSESSDSVEEISYAVNKTPTDLNTKTLLNHGKSLRFDDSSFSPSENKDSVGEWSIHQTAFKTFNDKLDLSWDKFPENPDKSHNSIHVVRRSNRKYEEIPRNSSRRNNSRNKEGNSPVWNVQENSSLNVRHPFLPKDDNGEPVELIFEVRTTEKTRTTTLRPRQEPVRIETVAPVQKSSSRRKPAPTLAPVAVFPVVNENNAPYLSLKPLIDNSKVPDGLLSKLQSNVYLSTVYNISKPPETVPNVDQSSESESDSSAKHVEQLTIAHFSHTGNNVMYKPVPISQQERMSTLAQQLNQPTESIFRIDAGIDMTTKPEGQQARKRRSPGGQEIINISSGGTTTEISLDVDQYPFYVAPPSDGLSKYSALRYASNPKDIPRKTQGGMEFYESRDRLMECEEPTPPKNIVPKREKDGEWNKNPELNGPRLGGLGDKISCLKAKYFGENPLDNPFFKETTVDVPNVFKTGQSEKLSDQLGLYMDIIGNINSNYGFNEKTSKQVQKSLNNFLSGQSLKRNVQNISSVHREELNKGENSTQQSSQEYKKSSTLIPNRPDSFKPSLTDPNSFQKYILSTTPKSIQTLRSNLANINDNKVNHSPYQIFSPNSEVNTLNSQWNPLPLNNQLPEQNLLQDQSVLIQTDVNSPRPETETNKPNRDYNRILGLRPPLPSFSKLYRVPRLIKPVYQSYNTFSIRQNPFQQMTQTQYVPRGFRVNLSNLQSASVVQHPLDTLGSQSVNKRRETLYNLPRATNVNKSALSIAGLKLLSIDTNGRVVAQITNPYILMPQVSKLYNYGISKRNLNLDNDRMWYPNTHDVRRGELKYSRRKRNADVNAAYINSRESIELINQLLRNKTLLLQATQESNLEKEGNKKQANLEKKKNIQTSRLGGFISRHNPAYSSRYRSTNSIHDSNMENSSKNNLVALGKAQTTTESIPRKSKVRFPKLNLNSKLVADINIKKNVTVGQPSEIKPIIVIPTTTTTTTTEPTTVTTTRMYKPRRIYKKDQAKGKIVDVFAVLNRQISTTTEKPMTTTILEDIVTELPEDDVQIKNKKPRRLQHVEHRRVTKEEVFKKTYIPHGIKDRSQESFESEYDHPDLKGPIERSLSDYEDEEYDLHPEGDMMHNETLVYMVDPKSGLGHWESVPYEKLNPDFVEEKVEKKGKRGSRQKSTTERSIDENSKRKDYEGRRRSVKKRKGRTENIPKQDKMDENPALVGHNQNYKLIEETMLTSEQPTRRRSRNKKNHNRTQNKVHVMNSLLQQVPPMKYIELPSLDESTEQQQPTRYFNPKIILEPDKRNYYYIQEKKE